MFRTGIIQKLAIALGSFGLLSIAAIFILYAMLQDFNSGLSRIMDVARPLGTASYEMKINALEVGLAVKGYLHRPETALRIAVEDAIMAFDTQHAIYQNIATNQSQWDMAAGIDQIFSNYAKEGMDLLDLKTVYGEYRAGFIAALVDLEARTKAIAGSDDPAITGTPENRLKHLQFFSILWAEISEALSLLENMNPDSGKSSAQFEEEIGKINILLNDYSENWPSESKPAWLDQMVEKFSQAAELSRRMVATSVQIDQGISLFFGYGTQLNDLLDDEVRRQSELNLKNLYDNLDTLILNAHRILMGWLPILFLGIGGLLFFIARSIVHPVQQLSIAADTISEGNFTHRVKDTQKDELGRLGQVFNTMADRLQTAYENLRRTNAELDTKVDRRTRQLADANGKLNNELMLRKYTENELRQAIAAANAANYAKTLFLGNMSHELRTPLNAIIGFSDVIKGELFGPVNNEKYLDYANDINQSGVHLLQLINELLDISRIEAGEMNLSEEKINLADCIAESLHMLEGQAAVRRVNLSHDIASELPFMQGDQTRIKQVMINLVGNAIKFTPPAGSVKVCALKSPDGGCLIKIIDTGIGISPENMAKVLEPFGQVANVLTRANEGAGLGLPLAKLLVERHEGTLTITSTPGSGTTVTVVFPASRCIPEDSGYKLTRPVIYR